MAKTKPTRKVTIKRPKIKDKSYRRLTLREELMEIDRQCVNVLATVNHQLLPLVVLNNEHKNFNELIDLSKIISRDILQMSNSLVDIRCNIPTELRRSNPQHTMAAIESSHAYNEWNYKFEQVIVPTVGKIVTLLNDSKVDLESKMKDIVEDSTVA